MKIASSKHLLLLCSISLGQISAKTENYTKPCISYSNADLDQNFKNKKLNTLQKKELYVNVQKLCHCQYEEMQKTKFAGEFEEIIQKKNDYLNIVNSMKKSTTGILDQFQNSTKTCHLRMLE